MSMCRRDFLVVSLAVSVSHGIRELNSAHGPVDMPGPPISAVKVGVPVKLSDNQGDTWAAAWADDGHLYSPSDDTTGFNKSCNSNVAFNRLDGSDPLQMTDANYPFRSKST
jgi:hypothetical protein